MRALVNAGPQVTLTISAATDIPVRRLSLAALATDLLSLSRRVFVSRGQLRASPFVFPVRNLAHRFTERGIEDVSPDGNPVLADNTSYDT